LLQQWELYLIVATIGVISIVATIGIFSIVATIGIFSIVATMDIIFYCCNNRNYFLLLQQWEL